MQRHTPLCADVLKGFGVSNGASLAVVNRTDGVSSFAIAESAQTGAIKKQNTRYMPLEQFSFDFADTPPPPTPRPTTSPHLPPPRAV